MKIKVILFLLINVFVIIGKSQMTLTLSQTQNTKCDGFGCNYNGASILINEVMLSPINGDGSIYGTMGGDIREGEWIELYNPNKCNSIDISCYFLGNNASDGGFNYPGGFVLPENTIVPPNGFCVVRGRNATPVPVNLLVEYGGKTIEIIVDFPKVCIGGGNRLWFPNAGGWFAFYNRQGVAQDAISWGSTTNSCMSCQPCNPSGCNYTGSLASFNTIPVNRKTYILNGAPISGNSYRRLPDGGNWSVNDAVPPTIGNCNASCITMPPITCNGTASVSVQGGTPPYIYSWSQGYLQTSSTAVGLCEGMTTVTVTDANGLTATGSIMVDLIDFDAQTNLISPIKCFNDNNGVATSLAIGGTPPYSYVWNTNPININQTATGLSVGNYMVKITDSNGCKDSATITLNQPTQLIVQTQLISPIKCFNDNNGAVTSVSSGGTPPYTYLWNTNPSNTNQSVSNLASGNYMIKVTDINGCKDSATITLNQPNVLDAQIDIINPINCFNENTGIIRAITNGGTIPYTYLWNTNPPSTNQSASNLPSGNYMVKISDFNGCKDSANIILNQPPELVTEIELISSIKCFNGNNGSANTLPIGGTPPYSYVWNTNPTNTNQINNQLTAGNHKVVITDANGCKDSATILLNQPPEIIVDIIRNNVKCFGDCDGSIQINATGGIFPYLYNINSASTTNYTTNLCIGNYLVSVTDANQCEITNNINIINNVNVNADFNVSPSEKGIAPLTCKFINKSTSGFQYFWDFGDGESSIEENPIYIFKNVGNYSVSLRVNSHEGCQDSINKIIIAYPELLVFIPNSFSPNEDDINEKFYPVINRILDDYQFHIYNRWGNLIYFTNNQYDKWDGKFKDTQATQGVYYYMIRFSLDGVSKLYHGSVTLIK